MSNAYGGAEIGSVGYENESESTIVGTTDINITGGTIGTEIKDGENNTKYTFGSVFGGGYGSTVEELEDELEEEARIENRRKKNKEVFSQPGSGAV